MGRLSHLKQTLPQRIHPDIENIVVDYGCPDKCGDWVEKNYPTVKVIRVKNVTTYNPSKSRNIGILAATCEWIVNVDADVFVDIQELFRQQLSFTAGNYYVRMPVQCIFRKGFPPVEIDGIEYRRWIYQDNDEPDQEKCGTFGFIIFNRIVLSRVLFDISLGAEYGYEDVDFRYQLGLNERLMENILPPGIIDVIQHDDEMRHENYQNPINSKKSFFGKWDDLRDRIGFLVNRSIKKEKRS